MVELFIDNKIVDIQSDFSAEIQYDNPYFTKSSDFSLDVELSLKSKTNRIIFGNVNRLDVKKEDKTFDCRMYANHILVFIGKATITKISDTTITLQFLGGNSIMNFYSDDIKIDTLDLGIVSGGTIPNNSQPGYWVIGKNQQDVLFGSVEVSDMVLFENVTYNDDKYLYPCADFLYKIGSIVTISQLESNPVQPYFTKVIQRIIEKIGYNLVRNDINNTWLKNIFIVNKKTKKKSNFFNHGGKISAYMNEALPHWSLNTFFNEIEKFFGVVIKVDDYKNVEIININDYYNNCTEKIYIDDKKIIDAFEVEFSDSQDDKNIMSGNIGYNKSYSDKYLKIDNSIIQDYNKIHYACFDDISYQFNSLSTEIKTKTIFIDDSNERQYIGYQNSDKNIVLKEINVFGDLLRENTTTIDVKLNIVPTDTLLKDTGIYLSTGTSEGDRRCSLTLPALVSSEIKTFENKQETIQKMIDDNLVVEEDDEDKDVIEVAISTGESYPIASWNGEIQYFPFPFTEFGMESSLKGKTKEYSLSLHNTSDTSIGGMFKKMNQLNSGKAIYIKFLSNKPYKSNSLFIIKNKAYIAKYLKTTYNTVDNVFIFEGEFYLYE